MEGSGRARRRCGPPPGPAAPRPRASTALKKKLKLMLGGYRSAEPAALLRAVEQAPRAPRDGSDSDIAEVAWLDDSSSAGEAAPLEGSPARALDSFSDESSPVPLESPTYKSYKDEEVRDMMETIGGILNESADESDQSFEIVPLEDSERSPHDIGTFVAVDSSLNETNFSSLSEFDADGQLASCILEKLLTRDEETEDQTESSVKNQKSLLKLSPKVKSLKNIDKSNTQLNTLTVENKPKKTEKHKKLRYKSIDLETYSESSSCIDSKQGLGDIKKRSIKVKILSDSAVVNGNPRKSTERSKSLKNKSNKKEQSDNSPPYVSIDARDTFLTNTPTLFQHYSFATNSNMSSEMKCKDVSNIYKTHKDCLSDAIINEVSFGNTSSTEGSPLSENYSPLNEDESALDRYQGLNSAQKSFNGSSIYEPVFSSPLPECLENISYEQNFTNSNFVEIKCLQNGCIMILRHPAQIYLHGKVKISSLCGSTDVLGYRLQEKCSEAYAPRYSHALTIRTEGLENIQFGLFGKLTRAGISVAESEDVVVSLGEYDSVLYLEPLKNKKFEFIDKNFATDVFNKPNKVISEQFPEAAEILSCSMYTDKPNRYFVENFSWNEIIEFGLGSNSKGIICGGKGTGKSTFLRYYVNKLLPQGPVVVIDLDPGQSEFTVAGNISVTVVNDPMIGPNFTHLQTPKRMLNLGMINVMDNLKRYIDAATNLLNYCTEEFENMPWIINTMGMCNSVGLKLITYIIMTAKPTFLVEMDSKVSRKCFRIVLNAEKLKNLYLEEYQDDRIFQNMSWPDELQFQHYVSTYSKLAEKKEHNLSPKDERYLNFLAYFGDLLSNCINDNLLAIRPYVVQLKSLRVRSTIKIDADLIMQVINGKIVALCQDNILSNNRTFALEENALLCHGHGLIRGIDEETESLYIITPAPREALRKINTIVYSDIYPDLLVSDSYLAPGTVVPYMIPLQDHNRQLTMTPKRRFNPLLLLKMKREGAD